MALSALCMIPDQGAVDDLAGHIALRLGTSIARLWDVFRVPHRADTPASFHEASFPGYVPQAALGWTPPAINGAGKAETDSRILTWTFTAGVGTARVYGVFVTDVSGLRLEAVYQFVGGQVVLTPVNPNLTLALQYTGVSEL